MHSIISEPRSSSCSSMPNSTDKLLDPCILRFPTCLITAVTLTHDLSHGTTTHLSIVLNFNRTFLTQLCLQWILLQRRSKGDYQTGNGIITKQRGYLPPTSSQKTKKLGPYHPFPWVEQSLNSTDWRHHGQKGWETRAMVISERPLAGILLVAMHCS